jgi:hypothetical protein
VPAIPDLITHFTHDQPPVREGLHTPTLIQTYLDTPSNCPESIDYIRLCVIQNRLANHLDGGVDVGGSGVGFSAEFI